MKSLIIIVVLLGVSGISQAQWPVNSGSQGEITGTIGEVRGNSGNRRIHNGTDCTGGANVGVYSIKDDQIQQINNASSLGVNRNIRMSSGARYFHVLYSNINEYDIDEINAGMVEVTVAQGEAFAEMIQKNGWPTHVHISTGVNINFLTSGGFNSPGYSLNDNFAPEFGGNEIKIYKDLNTGQLWNQEPEFTDYITNEGFPSGQQPLLVWGDVDIVANSFQRRIASNGNSLGAGHIAPFELGYNLKNLATSEVELEDFQRLQFHQGTSESSAFRKIHSKKSTSSNPHFIVSNRFLNGTAQEESLETCNYLDGDYKITVRARNTQDDNVERSVIARFDNFKTYIRKVQVRDEDNEVRYESEWSTLTRGGDGSIQVDRRNNEPFVVSSNCSIEATTSEKVPSLELKLPGEPPISMTQLDDDGMVWGGTFEMPNSASSKVQLRFDSEGRLFGLLLNQDAADVKRQENDNFLSMTSTDKNHELRICDGVEVPLSLEVEVDSSNNTSITLVATGGTEPYEYSQDLTPIPPQHQSNFSNNNIFEIDFDQNYLFKVKDSGGCEAQEYYTLPNVPCDAQNFAGGQGTDIRQVNLGTIEGTVTIEYQMYSIPDKMTVTYRGNSQTTGLTSGTGSISFVHAVEQGQSNQVTITMSAPNSGTAWNYQVVCPSIIQALSASDLTNEDNLDVSYTENGIIVSNKNFNSNPIYTLFYREIGEDYWSRIEKVRLPYELNSEGRDIEVKLSKDGLQPSLKSNLSVAPNPSMGLVNITYFSEKEGLVNLSMYNSSGKEIDRFQHAVNHGYNTLEWQPEDQHIGLLFIRVMQDGQFSSTEVVIEK